MGKVLLKNEAHLFQMLGALDSTNGYGLPKDIAEILIKLPKKPVVSKDEIDVGTNVAFLASGCGIEFCLQGSVLSLVEKAEEMGGLVAFTYLTPLAEITEEYFANLDANVDITPVRERVRQRRAQYTAMLAEHENLARGAMRRTHKILKIHPIPEFGEMLGVGKRFIRHGKPDFNSAQLQMLDFVIDKETLSHPVQATVNRWKTACNNKTSARVVTEPPVELHAPEILDIKKPKETKGKSLDFRGILAAMMKQDKPKQPPVRLKPSKRATEALAAEDEIEGDFELEPQKESAAEETLQPTGEEKKVQQLVSQLLEKKEGKQGAEADEAARKKSRTSLANKKQGLSAEHALASLNPELEQ